MTDKKPTWDTLLDFEDIEDSTRSIKDDKDAALPHGYVHTVGNTGIRFLIVDDSSDVIRNHIENFTYLQKERRGGYEDFTAALWHADKSAEGNFEAFLGWLSHQKKFDGIFLDADLKMDQQTGFDLANLIHSVDEFRYQPLCILTAQYSNQRDKAQRNPHIKLLLKFKKLQSHDYALTQMFAALPELNDAMRRKFWADCHDEIVAALEDGNASSKTVAERLGNYLTTYHGVNGWYLRKREGGRLRALAMNDQYEGKDCLLLKNLPGFLADALANSSANSEIPRARSVCQNFLPIELCGSFPVLAGKHAIAVVMRADNDDLTGLFSLYRDGDQPGFTEEDERQLQQLVVHIQTLMVSEAKQSFQTDLLEAIDAAREAETVEEMSENVLPFLHKTINPWRFDDEFCKSSFRVYDSGTGNLKRVGGLLGNCTEKPDQIDAVLSVSDEESTIARAVLDRRSIRYGNVYLEKARTVETSIEELPASLVVPLSFDGAVLGALNFESSVAGKFDDASEALAEQFGSLLASILFRRRSERFLQEFAGLSADLISGNHTRALDTHRVLQTCMAMLFDFSRFSNALFIEIEDLEEISNVDAWDIQSWSADRISSRTDFFEKSFDTEQRTEKWRDALKQAGESAFLNRCLLARDGHSVYFTDNLDAIPQADVAVGIRDEGKKTLSQMVIKVFSPRGSLVALCLLFDNPAPFTRGYRAVVEKFAEFVSYLGSSRFINKVHPYSRVDQYEKQLFAMYSLLMHSQKKISAGIVRELEKTIVTPREFEVRVERIKKKASLNQLNSEIGKAVLAADSTAEKFDLRELWRELIDAYQVFFDDFDAQIEDMAESTDYFCEKTKLKTILSILLGNSIEHGGQGFSVHLQRNEDGNLVYWDTGLGIPDGAGDQIFSHYTSSGTGSGTGLIIARLLGARANLNITRAQAPSQSGAAFSIEKKRK